MEIRMRLGLAKVTDLGIPTAICWLTRKQMLRPMENLKKMLTLTPIEMDSGLEIVREIRWQTEIGWGSVMGIQKGLWMDLRRQSQTGSGWHLEIPIEILTGSGLETLKLTGKLTLSEMDLPTEMNSPIHLWRD